MPVKNATANAALRCSWWAEDFGVRLNAISATANRISTGTTASNTLWGSASSRIPPVSGRAGREVPPGERAERGADREPHHAGALAAQLLAVADRAADVAEREAEAVGHVRGDRRGADGRQRRERDQRAGAHDRVDAARREARREHRQRLG